MMTSRNKAILLFIFFLTALLPFACTENEKQEPENPSTVKNIPTTSFVIALLPQRNVFLQKKRYKALADYLSKSTGMNVKTKLLDSYDAVYNEMLQDKVNAAFFGSLSYVATNSKIPLEPIARPYLKDGTSTYRGVIFTVKDKGITGDVRTWKDKRIALVSKSTTAGYIFPRWYLQKEGIINLERHFRKVIYTGSHDSSIRTVFQNEADIGCSMDKVFNELVEKDPLMREKLMSIASSTPVPYNTLGISKGTDAKLKASLKTVLLNMDKTPEGRAILAMLGATRYIETRESEFMPIYEMLNTLGMKPGDFGLEVIGKNDLTPASPEQKTHQ